MLSSNIIELADNFVNAAKATGFRVAVAESCTGGLLSAYITAIPGSSEVLERGFVSYSDKSKQEMLGVSKMSIITHTSVSEVVAKQMVEGVFEYYSKIHAALSITGFAGPAGALDNKDIGVVFIGYGYISKGLQSIKVIKFKFEGDRDAIRNNACKESLKILTNLIPLK